MKTYLLSIILAYILTKFAANILLRIARRFNLLAAPEENSLFPFPTLKGYSALIIFPVFLLSMIISLYVNKRLPEFYTEKSNFFNSLMIIMILNIFLPFVIKSRKISITLLSAFNTYLAYYNNINIDFFSENLWFSLPLTFLWFVFFQMIFYNNEEHTGNNLLITGIVLINLFFITLFLEQILSSQIFLVLGVSILSLQTYTSHPAKITPTRNFYLWYGSVIAYISLHNQLKFTILSLLFMIPMANLLNSVRSESTFSMSLLKNGIPENRISRILFLLQIIAGIAGFSMIIMRNELISFFIAITIFIVFYILLTQEQHSGK
ncbi:MAG: hypothetical protein C0601_10980 [Candidatus Muiribacterium halophilum]|uniref:Uncharacterized protein n=1 Tax=Muiribacterium halophilum TaxID=2053465 RepID=A0A2N5ZBV6_MUIH1|nr:MAG: hypothetical protein C0601_10980 [Candidatus Muirbacterium halophilum]